MAPSMDFSFFGIFVTASVVASRVTTAASSPASCRPEPRSASTTGVNQASQQILTYHLSETPLEVTSHSDRIPSGRKGSLGTNDTNRERQS
jgi:hypothetical protein